MHKWFNGDNTFSTKKTEKSVQSNQTLMQQNYSLFSFVSNIVVNQNVNVNNICKGKNEYCLL